MDLSKKVLLPIKMRRSENRRKMKGLKTEGKKGAFYP
jgi:hypothetical protein